MYVIPICVSRCEGIIGVRTKRNEKQTCRSFGSGSRRRTQLRISICYVWYDTWYKEQGRFQSTYGLALTYEWGDSQVSGKISAGRAALVLEERRQDYAEKNKLGNATRHMINYLPRWKCCRQRSVVVHLR